MPFVESPLWDDVLARLKHALVATERPHRPLLLLFVLSRAQDAAQGPDFTYRDVASTVTPLLKQIVGSSQAYLPFWALHNDPSGFWRIRDAELLVPLRAEGDRPRPEVFTRLNPTASVAANYWAELRAPGVIPRLTERLLSEFFDDSQATLLRRAFGLSAANPRGVVPHLRLRFAITSALTTLPLRTPRGIVDKGTTAVHFGYPGGSHEPVACWRYRTTGSEVELLFGFYSNFTENDLICKVVHAGAAVDPGSGASIQFNGGLRVHDDGTDLILDHDGRVTLKSGVSRHDLVSAIREHAPDADAALGGLDSRAGWPFFVGSSSNLAALIDRLALYAYAVEQAKRSMRREAPLPRLYPKGSAEERVSTVPGASATRQGFLSSAEARAAVEERAMLMAIEHLRREWDAVENVSKNRPYDLHCTRGPEELRVEVKGTTQDGTAVWLTRGEVDHARTHYPRVALYVVSGIEVTGDNPPATSGGVLRVLQPWRVDDCVLEPVTYACELPANR